MNNSRNGPMYKRHYMAERFRSSLPPKRLFEIQPVIESVYKIYCACSNGTWNIGETSTIFQWKYLTLGTTSVVWRQVFLQYNVKTLNFWLWINTWRITPAWVRRIKYSNQWDPPWSNFVTQLQASLPSISNSSTWIFIIRWYFSSIRCPCMQDALPSHTW